MRLREGKYSAECLITEIHPSFALLEPSKSVMVSLELFPKVCGVVKVSGLEFFERGNRLIDLYSAHFAQITCEY